MLTLSLSFSDFLNPLPKWSFLIEFGKETSHCRKEDVGFPLILACLEFSTMEGIKGEVPRSLGKAPLFIIQVCQVSVAGFLCNSPEAWRQEEALLPRYSSPKLGPGPTETQVKSASSAAPSCLSPSAHLLLLPKEPVLTVLFFIRRYTPPGSDWTWGFAIASPLLIPLVGILGMVWVRQFS